MLPFFIQSSIQNTQHRCQERQREWVEYSIEEASYDAGFALKTYSTYAYNSNEAYNIQTPYQEVIDNFFDSLIFRGLKFTPDDFPLIAFIDYDGLVLYNPVEDTFSEKKFYVVSKAQVCEYYSLSEDKRIFYYETGTYEIQRVSSEERHSIIMQTMEKVLNEYQEKYQERNGIHFVLPEFEGKTTELIIDDVGLIIFYNPQNYSHLDGLETYKIIPSGIMKMDLPIDL